MPPPGARTAIRHYLKSLRQEDTVALGMKLLEKALNARGSSIDQLPDERWATYLKNNHFARQEDLFHDLALGASLANVVAAKLLPEVGLLPGARDQGEAITIAGTEGNALSFGACCTPVPGDDIMAYVSVDKGLVVHRVNCANVREFRKHPDRCVAVNWAPITQGMFPVAVMIEAHNTPGVLAISDVPMTVADAISLSGGLTEDAHKGGVCTTPRLTRKRFSPLPSATNPSASAIHTS